MVRARETFVYLLVANPIEQVFGTGSDVYVAGIVFSASYEVEGWIFPCTEYG